MTYHFETERLRLRDILVSDAEAMYELNRDPEVVRYTAEPPFESVQHARQVLEKYKDYELYGMGRWVCERKEDGAIIGWCGLKYYPETKEIDLGYRFSQRYWNMGYATESSIGCLRFGFETLKIKRINAAALPENPTSFRVMEKVGMKYWKSEPDEDGDWVYYLINSDEWFSLVDSGSFDQ